jgi:membrane protein YqaA with SNARE-associated domain
LKRITAIFLKYEVLVLSALKPLGVWGLGLLALMDSSTLPVPMDLIVAGYVWTHQEKAILYIAAAAIGSTIGGLLPFYLGRAGGELFLLKRINRARYEQLRDRFERQEFLALMVPSMLPPPTPWKVFVFGGGVFGVKTWTFLAAVLAGRLVRFSVLAFLTLRYGPEMVHILSETARKHLALLMLGLAVVLVVLAVVAVRKAKGKRIAAEA